MRVALVSFDFVHPGVKTLASYLKSQGVETSIIYLRPERVYDCSYTFPDQLKFNLSELVKDFDLVGISVMTSYFFLASDLTRCLKNSGSPLVVWGGIHPTIDPEECLEYADGVAIGEAEHSLAALAGRLEGGKEYLTTPGFWFRQADSVIRNELRTPPADLDALPLPDLGYQGHYIREGNTIVRLDQDRLRAEFMKNGLRDLEGRFYPTYICVFSRGCPFSCSFCCNNLLNQLFGVSRKKVRIRSLDKILAEVKLARALVPEFGFVSIDDDNFLAQPVETIAEFARRWPAEVGLPFKISGSVHFMEDRRISLLVEAGMMHIQLGVQSGSDSLNRRVYQRNVTAEMNLQAARVLNRYRGRLLPVYDFIFDNPYENARDRLHTARLILALPRPHSFSSFSLVYYPGTRLYKMALEDKLISDKKTQIYGKKANSFDLGRVSYLKLVSLLLPSLPKSLGKILVWTPWALFWELPLWTPFFTLAARTLLWLRKNEIIVRANVSRFIRPGTGGAPEKSP